MKKKLAGRTIQSFSTLKVLNLYLPCCKYIKIEIFHPAYVNHKIVENKPWLKYFANRYAIANFNFTRLFTDAIQVEIFLFVYSFQLSHFQRVTNIINKVGKQQTHKQTACDAQVPSQSTLLFVTFLELFFSLCSVNST